MAASELSALVADKTIDLGLAVRWPGDVEASFAGVEALPLGAEELVIVGALPSPGSEAPIADLAGRLIVAGPYPEFEEGVRRLLASQTGSPVLAHTVGDVASGFRIASITGGAMVLPRSMATGTALPVRPIQPATTMETVLLATKERSMDEEVFSIVVAIHEALTAVESPTPAGVS